MAIQKIKITECPFCGGTEFVKGVQNWHSLMFPCNGSIWGTGQEIRHIVCKRCGSVVRSYVLEPELLAPLKKPKKE